MPEILNLSLGVIITLLRIAVVFLLYFFLWQVLRVLINSLRGAAPGTTAPLNSALGQLVIKSAGQSGLPVGKTFPLDLSNSIGRDLDNDIALNDSFLSAKHARLERRNSDWLLEDLGSTNGTFVNGVELRGSTVVDYGDIIRVGRVELQLKR